MRLTITLHLWWLGAYLAVGALGFLPFNLLAWRTLHKPAGSFWRSLFRPSLRETATAWTVQIVAWPLCLWELR